MGRATAIGAVVAVGAATAAGAVAGRLAGRPRAVPLPVPLRVPLRVAALLADRPRGVPRLMAPLRVVVRLTALPVVRLAATPPPKAITVRCGRPRSCRNGEAAALACAISGALHARDGVLLGRVSRICRHAHCLRGFGVRGTMEPICTEKRQRVMHAAYEGDKLWI